MHIKAKTGFNLNEAFASDAKPWDHYLSQGANASITIDMWEGAHELIG